MRHGEDAFVTVGQSLWEIFSRKLYLVEYAAWEDFCEHEISKTRQHVQRIIKAFKGSSFLESPDKKPAQLPPPSADEPEAGPKPEPEKRDRAPIDDSRLAPVFKAAEGFTRLLHLVGEIKTLVDDLTATPAGSLLAENAQVIERDRRNIKELVKFCKPHAICPYCGASGKECRGCKSRGWVNEDVYKRSGLSKAAAKKDKP